MSAPTATSLATKLREGYNITANLSELIDRLWPDIDCSLQVRLTDIRMELGRLYQARAHLRSDSALAHAVESCIKSSKKLHDSLASYARFMTSETGTASRAKQAVSYFIVMRVQQRGKKKRVVQAREELISRMYQLSAENRWILDGTRILPGSRSGEPRDS